MRKKKMLFLALALAATASLTTPLTAATTTYHGCPVCTTYPDGSQCCIGCVCDNKGHVVACTNQICP